MKLGVLSDSHGREHRVREALTLLDRAGAEAFVHCGDVGSLDVLEAFAGRRLWVVWGNTDFPEPAWRAQLESLGIPWPDGPLHLHLAGRQVGIYHGHEYRFEHAIRSGRFDYILHGHSHRRDDYRVGQTRVVNPGALHRVAVPTVATLDLDADTVEFLSLE
jgi:putative phosphoesterase